MSDDKEPQPVDAEFEPARDSAPPPAKLRTPWGGLFLTFVFAAFAGGGLGALLAWVMDQTPQADEPAIADISAMEARLDALESVEPVVTFDPSSLEARLAALEGEPELDLDSIEARITALESAPEGPATGETIDLAPLETRLEALESEQERLAALANQALDGLGEARNDANPALIAALEARVSALETAEPVTPPIVDLAPIETRLAALEGAEPADVFDPSDLEARLMALENAPTETVDLSGIEARISALETRAAENSAAASDADQAGRSLAARSLALVALTEQARTPAPFEAERAALARLWNGQAALTSLAAHSRSGVADIDTLSETFPRDDIENAIGTHRVFFGLIELRPSTGSETGPLARIALAVERLDDGDLEGAIALTEQLEGDALEAAQSWLVNARARQNVDEALEALRRDLTRLAADAGADPT